MSFALNFSILSDSLVSFLFSLTNLVIESFVVVDDVDVDDDFRLQINTVILSVLLRLCFYLSYCYRLNFRQHNGKSGVQCYLRVLSVQIE